jgi:dihydrofolate reductase
LTVGRLIYMAIPSLDGYVNDEQGKFDWAMPDAEVHAFVNDLERPIGTHLYGRRMYETLAFWETLESDHPVMRDFARVWRAADKVVYSRTLEAVSSARTRIEREFDPDAVRALPGDISIGGPTLAAEAFRAGLVDECHLLLNPVVVGGGTPALPRDLRLDLELLGQRRFSGGVVHLHYRSRAAAIPSSSQSSPSSKRAAGGSSERPPASQRPISGNSPPDSSS